MTAWQFWAPAVSLLVVTACLLWHIANRHSEAAVNATQVAPSGQLPRDSLLNWLQAHLLAAGIDLSHRRLLWIAVGWLVVILVAAWLVEGNIAVVMLLLAPLLLHGMLRLKAQRLRRRLRAQLPKFLESVLRNIGIGATTEQAFRRDIERVPPPLGDVLRRIRRRRDLGMELHDGLRREARLMKVHEFDLLASAVEINQVHGGSMKNILESFVAMLRQRETSQRELKALTGETRVTAVVLGSVPVMLAGVMFFTQPEFLTPMLNSESGRMALWIALGLELAGCLALWRILKSI